MPKYIAQEGEDFVVEQVSRTTSATRVTALKVDGATGVTSIGGLTVATAAQFLPAVVTGLAAAGSIVLAGADVGDKVVMVTNLTTPANASTLFETTITVAGHIQQTSATDLSASKFQVLVLMQ